MGGAELLESLHCLAGASEGGEGAGLLEHGGGHPARRRVESGELGELAYLGVEVAAETGHHGPAVVGVVGIGASGLNCGGVVGLGAAVVAGIILAVGEPDAAVGKYRGGERAPLEQRGEDVGGRLILLPLHEGVGEIIAGEGKVGTQCGAALTRLGALDKRAVGLLGSVPVLKGIEGVAEPQRGAGGELPVGGLGGGGIAERPRGIARAPVGHRLHSDLVVGLLDRLPHLGRRAGDALEHTEGRGIRLFVVVGHGEVFLGIVGVARVGILLEEALEHRDGAAERYLAATGACGHIII